MDFWDAFCNDFEHRSAFFGVRKCNIPVIPIVVIRIERFTTGLSSADNVHKIACVHNGYYLACISDHSNLSCSGTAIIWK